ncbi:MAG: alkaline phosphatase family protein, partial [Planctomycetota bacterium]
RTFWDIAGEQGIRGGVINVPVTYPPRPFNGFIITGLLSPGVNRRMASPPEVLDDLLAASADYAVDVNVTSDGVRDIKSVFLDTTLRVIEARKKAAVGLYRKHRPPLFVAAFTASDRICHFFWNYHQAVMNEALDDAVGELVAAAGDDTDVLIMSDHGAGRLVKGVNLRKVLARAGLMVEVNPGPLGRLTRWGIEKFAKVAPMTFKSWIKAHFKGLTRRAASTLALAGIDFSTSRAYPSGDSAGVFVNLKGRQPQGIVAPGAEYEAVRDRIIRALTDVVDPETNLPVAKAVHRREEVWSGPALESLPDVILEQREMIYDTRLINEASGDDIFYELPRPTRTKLFHVGGHRRNGLFMARGPHIRKGATRDAGIADVPATVLALLGCTIPDNLDGRPLAEILTDDVELPSRTEATPQAQPAEGELSDQEKQAVEQRLKDLGYM